MANHAVTRVALLIDADNLSGDVIGQAVAHLLRLYGAVHFRRAYASPQKVIEHSELFRRLAIRPMVNVPTGKNSTDIALAVDAIDLAICERPDVVVIASSDSDYAPLAQRLREKGCTVLGIGQAGKTGAESPLAYDEFIDLTHRGKGGFATRGALATTTSSPATPARSVTPAPAPRPSSGRSGRVTRRDTPTRSDAESGPSFVSDAAPARQKRSSPTAATKPAAAAAMAPSPAPLPAPPTAPASTRSPRTALSASSPLPPEVQGILDALPALRGGVSVQLGEVGEVLRRLGVLNGKRASVSGYLKRHAAWFELLPADRPRTVRYFDADQN